MKINPLAVVIWIFAGIIGFLITDTFRGFAVGVAITMAISLTVDILESFR